MPRENDLRKHWIVSRCLKTDTILDIGCADGWIFSNTDLDVTYCDINEFNIPHFICADAQNLPFKDNQFDICCLNEILEHSQNPIKILLEAIRVCSQKVILTVPNEWIWLKEYKPCMPIQERLKELGGISVEQMYLQDNPLCKKINDSEAVYHHRWYKQNELEADIKGCGLPYKFELLNYEGWSFFIAEIYKDGIPDGELKDKLKLPSVLKTPSPSPSVIGYIHYETLPQPQCLHIDTFAYCDAKCAFCRYPNMTRPKGTMDIKLLEKILDDAFQWAEPPKEVVPIHYGEFFLHPKWYDILKLIERKLPNSQIILPTNGSKLDFNIASKLATIQTLKVINISINAFFNETYEVVIGLPSEMINNIKKVCQYLRILAPHINIWCSMVYDPTYQTEKERDLFIEEWRKYGYTQVHPASFCEDYRKPLVPSQIPCRSIFIDFIILWNGRVAPCCWDSNGEMVVGDVNNQKILDIWHGEPMNNLRRLHNDGKRSEIKLCKVCSFS